jgi:hypothetical protein
MQYVSNTSNTVQDEGGFTLPRTVCRSIKYALNTNRESAGPRELDANGSACQSQVYSVGRKHFSRSQASQDEPLGRWCFAERIDAFIDA